MKLCYIKKQLAKIKSRHTSADSHNLWIEFGPGLEPIRYGFVNAKVVLGLLGVVPI